MPRPVDFRKVRIDIFFRAALARSWYNALRGRSIHNARPEAKPYIVWHKRQGYPCKRMHQRIHAHITYTSVSDRQTRIAHGIDIISLHKESTLSRVIYTIKEGREVSSARYALRYLHNGFSRWNDATYARMHVGRCIRSRAYGTGACVHAHGRWPYENYQLPTDALHHRQRRPLS